MADTLVYTGYGNGEPSHPIKVYVGYTASQDVTNNKSTVTCYLWVRVPSSYNIGPWTDRYGSYVGQKDKTFNGSIANIKTGDHNISGTKTFTVKHNDDGTGAATIYWKWGVNSSWGKIQNISGSFNITLPTIPRASQPSCVTWPQTTDNVGNIGSTIAIHMNRKSGNFTHNVEWTWYGKSGPIATGVTNNCMWPILIDFCDAIPNANKGQGIITAYTYDGSTEIGSKSVSFYANVPDNESTKPSVAISVSPVNTWLTSANPKYDDLKNLYIQGMSQAGVTVSAEGKYNTTINSYSTVIEGKTYTNAAFTSDKLQNSGTVSVDSKATDKRTISNSAQSNITVLPYSAPAVVPINGQSKIICSRCDENGNLTSNGTHLKIAAKRKFSPLLVSDLPVNACDLYYAIKLHTAQDYGPWNTLIAKSTSAANEYNAVVSGVNLSVSSMYDVRIAVCDELDNWNTADFTVPTEEIPLDLAEGGLNIAVGRRAKTDGSRTFDCGWDANFEKTLGIGGNAIADFVVEQGTSGIWTWRKWSNGVAECWGTTPLKTITANDWKLWGGCYVVSVDNPKYPDGLFVSIPMAVWSVNTTNFPGWATKDETYLNELGMVSLGSNDTRNVTANISVKVIGRWK